MGGAHILVIALFCLLLVLPITTFAYRATPDLFEAKWCGIMFAIYGVCSPELIDNYLLMTYDPPKPPKTMQTSVASTFPIVVVKEAEKPPVLDNPAYRYSYYWNGVVWVKSRLIA